ncbi:hypothetical protein ACIOWG_19780 [Streptomyces sp. NPDC087658]|uniref:hypothetical protein n=1 Tax=Streptomyces sp. NPDC087658 TaxID=3365800 RepID=UPI00381213A0
MNPEPTEPPRADCAVDPAGRLSVRLDLPSATRPQLFLRQRPGKGASEEGGHLLDLEPDGDGAPGTWRTVLDVEPVLAEGRWDTYVMDAPGAPRRRLLPGRRDLRALTAAPDPAADRPAPLAVRIPYATKDGYLAVRTWLRAAHAEVDTVRLDGRALTVRGRLFGASPGKGATVLLVRRGKGGPVRESALTPEGRRGFSFTADYAGLLAGHGTAREIWDIFIRPTADAPRIRVGRLLDDLADRKEVFVYPAVTRDGVSVRPYYTVDNDLAVDVGGG